MLQSLPGDSGWEVACSLVPGAGALARERRDLHPWQQEVKEQLSQLEPADELLVLEEDVVAMPSGEECEELFISYNMSFFQQCCQGGDPRCLLLALHRVLRVEQEEVANLSDEKSGDAGEISQRKEVEDAIRASELVGDHEEVRGGGLGMLELSKVPSSKVNVAKKFQEKITFVVLQKESWSRFFGVVCIFFIVLCVFLVLVYLIMVRLNKAPLRKYEVIFPSSLP